MKAERFFLYPILEQKFQEVQRTGFENKHTIILSIGFVQLPVIRIFPKNFF